VITVFYEVIMNHKSTGRGLVEDLKEQIEQ
jgi:hypothetical protein